MTRLFSRRGLLTAGGVAAASLPLATVGPRAVGAAAPPIAGQLVTLLTPLRVFDSRQPGTPLNGAKLSSGEAVDVTVSPAFPEFALAVFANITVTQTEGSGYLVVSGSDSSGELPVPQTSNINWSSAGQTLANLVLTTVGSENAITVRCDGGGRTHFIVDIQGYVPFVATI